MCSKGNNKQDEKISHKLIKIIQKLCDQQFPKYTDRYYNSIKKTNTQLKNGGKNPSTHFPKKDIIMANVYMKRCSASLILKEIQYEALHTYIHIGFETYKFVFLYSTVGNL